MPDHTTMYPNERSARPHGWGDAFATLPLETPDADAWQRLQRARTQPARKRWPVWFAAAAVLALAAVLPWQLTRTEAGTEVEASANAPATTTATATVSRGDVQNQPEAATDALAAATAANEPVHAAAAPGGNAVASPAAKPAAARDDAVAAVRNVPKPAVRRTDDAGSRAFAVEAEPEGATASGQTRSPRPWPQPATNPQADPQLERLYAESAQLEALVALARDDRVATGAAATLTSAYDAQVAGIDASLRDADINASQRAALWQQRVDALRQLAGFETTQRALAAQGERYDAMLVSID